MGGWHHTLCRVIPYTVWSASPAQLRVYIYCTAKLPAKCLLARDMANQKLTTGLSVSTQKFHSNPHANVKAATTFVRPSYTVPKICPWRQSGLVIIIEPPTVRTHGHSTCTRMRTAIYPNQNRVHTSICICTQYIDGQGRIHIYIYIRQSTLVVNDSGGLWAHIH